MQIVREFPLLTLLEVGVPMARQSDPETSKAAAAKVKYQSLRHEILTILAPSHEGMASYEVADIMRLRRDIVSPHFAPLRRLGFIEICGKKINPETKSKSENQLYRVTDAYRNHQISTEKFTRRIPDATECRKIAKKQS